MHREHRGFACPRVLGAFVIAIVGAAGLLSGCEPVQSGSECAVVNGQYVCVREMHEGDRLEVAIDSALGTDGGRFVLEMPDSIEGVHLVNRFDVYSNINAWPPEDWLALSVELDVTGGRVELVSVSEVPTSSLAASRPRIPGLRGTLLYKGVPYQGAGPSLFEPCRSTIGLSKPWLVIDGSAGTARGVIGEDCRFFGDLDLLAGASLWLRASGMSGSVPVEHDMLLVADTGSRVEWGGTERTIFDVMREDPNALTGRAVEVTFRVEDDAAFVEHMEVLD